MSQFSTGWPLAPTHSQYGSPKQYHSQIIKNYHLFKRTNNEYKFDLWQKCARLTQAASDNTISERNERMRGCISFGIIFETRFI